MSAEDHRPLALLIPGLDGTGMLYFQQLESLRRHYRPVAWKFRNRCDFELPDLVAELDEGTSQEKAGSILVVGESFGGLPAILYVLTYPQRIRQLILVNAFPYYRRRLRIRLAYRLSLLLRWRVSHRVKDLVADRILRAEGIPQDHIDRYHEIVRQVHLPAFQQRLRLIRQADLRPRLEEIAVPVTILASGRDKLVPSALEARFMADRIPRAVVHEFPRAGHALLLTPGFELADYLGEGILRIPSLYREEGRDVAEAGEM